MSLKRRTSRMMEQEKARRQAAWKPAEVLAARDLGIAVGPAVRAHRQFTKMSQAKQDAAKGRVVLNWDSEEQARSWHEWFRTVEDVLQTEGLEDDLKAIYPSQLPAPPEEPAGMWARLVDLVQSDRDDPLRGAASCWLVWFAIARWLRHTAKTHDH